MMREKSHIMPKKGSDFHFSSEPARGMTYDLTELFYFALFERLAIL